MLEFDNNNSTTVNQQFKGERAIPPNWKLTALGVSVSFTYQDMPITWQWALTPKPTLSNNSQNLDKNVGNNSSDTNNNNSDVDNNDTVKNDD